MNVNRLELMVTMLKEVEAGTWKASPTRLKQIFDDVKYNLAMFKEGTDNLKDFVKSPKEFDLQTWFDDSPHNEKNEETCGFTACAVGHAMLDPRFNRMGLKSAYVGWSGVLKPKHGNNLEFEAVQSFFELTSEVAESLFMPTVYPPHLVDKALVVQVRRRIQKLLELGEQKFSETKLCDNDENNEMLVSPKGRIYREYKEYK